MKNFKNLVASATAVAVAAGSLLTASTAIAGPEGGNMNTPGELVIGYGAGGDGFFEARDSTAPYGTTFFGRTGYGAYNSSGPGQTFPILCNLDNDADAELVLGFGDIGQSGGVLGGFIEIRDIRSANHVSVSFLRANVPGTTFQANNGETRPACGDIDDDGRDEIVVGLGSGSLGFVQVFDDAVAGFAPMGGTPFPGGFLRFPQPGAYNSTNGETFVAVGNLDGDSAEEIAIGGGNGAEGLVALIDDAGASFAALSGTPIGGGFVRLKLPGGYNAANGTVHPAICDLDGVGNGELVLGVGVGGGGFAEVKDASASFGPASGTAFPDGFTRILFPGTYRSTNGTTKPFCGDLDGDGRDELGLGTGDSDTGVDGGDGFVELKGDLTNESVGGSDFVRANSGSFRATGNGATGTIVEVVPPPS